VMLIAGTDDPMLPYEGGPSRGPLASATRKRVREMLLDPSGHDAVAPEALAAEWAEANRCAGKASLERAGVTAQHFPVDRLHWGAGPPGEPAVTLYRIAGGGHGWPSARQYLPKRFLGAIPQGWDGTGLLLQFARACVARGL
jgi:poly(3-hydroxybutyrate) depolymerase